MPVISLRKVLGLTFAGVCLLGFNARAATVTWIGPTGDWNSATNWSAGALPQADDDVVINGPGITVTHSSGTHTIKSLQTDQTCTLSGGTLTLVSTSQVSGTFNLSAGALAGSGDLTVAGTFNWSGGTMSGSGKTIIAASTGTLNMSGGTHELYRVLQNDGTATWTLGVIVMADGTFNNNGTFVVNTGSTLDCYGNGG